MEHVQEMEVDGPQMFEESHEEREMCVESQNICQDTNKTFEASQATEIYDTCRMRKKLKASTNVEGSIKNVTNEITHVKVVEYFKLNTGEQLNGKITSRINKMNHELTTATVANDVCKKHLEQDKNDESQLVARTEAVGVLVQNLTDFVVKIKHILENINHENQLHQFLQLQENVKEYLNKYRELHAKKTVLVANLKAKRNKEAREVKLKIEEVNKRKEEVIQGLFQIKKQLKSLTKEYEEQENIRNSFQQQHATLVEKQKSLIDELNLKNNELINIKELFALRQIELKSAMENIAAYEQKIKEFQENFQSFLKQVDESKKILHSKQERFENLRNEGEELARQFQEQVTIFDKKKESFTNLENLYKTKVQNYTETIKQLKEKYEIVKTGRKNLEERLKKKNVDYLLLLEEKMSLYSAEVELKNCLSEVKHNIAIEKERTKTLSEKYFTKNTELEDVNKRVMNIRNNIDEELKTYQSEHDSVQQQIDAIRLNRSNKLEVLQKDKDYAQASNNYLKEKKKKLEEQLDLIRADCTQIREAVIISNALKDSKEDKLNKLTAYYNKIKGTKTAEKPGILKSSIRTPQGPSPKKVKFEGVPSSESSIDTNPNPKAKTLDDWIKEINAREANTTSK